MVLFLVISALYRFVLAASLFAAPSTILLNSSSILSSKSASNALVAIKRCFPDSWFAVYLLTKPVKSDHFGGMNA